MTQEVVQDSEENQRKQFLKAAKKSGNDFKKQIINSIMSLEREGYGE